MPTWREGTYVEGRDNKQKVKTLSGAILILLGRGDVAGEFTAGDVMVYHCWSMVLIASLAIQLLPAIGSVTSL